MENQSKYIMIEGFREEYGTIVLPEALEEEEPITINNKKNGKSK
jgi:hypothetical protein